MYELESRDVCRASLRTERRNRNHTDANFGSVDPEMYYGDNGDRIMAGAHAVATCRN
jgi:hypothetical protein